MFSFSKKQESYQSWDDIVELSSFILNSGQSFIRKVGIILLMWTRRTSADGRFGSTHKMQWIQLERK